MRWRSGKQGGTWGHPETAAEARNRFAMNAMNATTLARAILVDRVRPMRSSTIASVAPRVPHATCQAVRAIRASVVTGATAGRGATRARATVNAARRVACATSLTPARASAVRRMRAMMPPGQRAAHAPPTTMPRDGSDRLPAAPTMRTIAATAGARVPRAMRRRGAHAIRAASFHLATNVMRAMGAIWGRRPAGASRDPITAIGQPGYANVGARRAPRALTLPLRRHAARSHCAARLARVGAANGCCAIGHLMSGASGKHLAARAILGGRADPASRRATSGTSHDIGPIASARAARATRMNGTSRAAGAIASARTARMRTTNGMRWTRAGDRTRGRGAPRAPPRAPATTCARARTVWTRRPGPRAATGARPSSAVAARSPR